MDTIAAYTLKFVLYESLHLHACTQLFMTYDSCQPRPHLCINLTHENILLYTQ